ncbi:cytochrome P450 [Podospora australis]|uniref:Cytochrome P450 n=1 Tax=Podospora australis TaxID=1536484 RepID=A0AAN6WIL7_9PEZI|nr:cytochrome P450 [Podospora australis]
MFFAMLPDSSAAVIAAVVVAVFSSGIVYFIRRLNEQRRFYRDNDVPKPPHDWLWGHAKIVGEYGKKITGDYMQAAWAQMKYDHKLPEVFYLDLWPFGPEFIICSGPDAMALPTTANSYAQADIVTKFFGQSVGTTFIEATNGPLWKELHQMLAPGLTPSATKTYHDPIFHEAKQLHDRIRSLAATEEVIDISAELGRFPFAVIWRVMFGETSTGHLYDDTKRLADISSSVPRTMNPIVLHSEKRERAAIVKRLEAEIGKITRTRFSELKADKSNLPTRTTATCLLDRMLLGHLQDGLPLDDRLMRLIHENGKGMLAAGYGTTTDTSSYVFMLLSVFPSVLQKLREEHDRVFPNDLGGTLELLRSDPFIITKELPYTTAVIQETLRLFPIGMVVRALPPGMTSFDLNGKTYPVRPSNYFGVLSYASHYDPNIFDSPSDFRPERFLAEEPDFPRNAYRPFERGLRSCIGQSLAMDEMRISLVMLARWFDFELRDHNPVKVPRLSHTDLDTKLGDHAFQMSRFSAGPNGAAMMKVRVARR